MTPTVNSTDVYVPSIKCFPIDDAADVVTPPVCAAALAASDGVSCPLIPGAATVVLALASGLGVAVELALLLLLLVLDVLSALVAKPGHN
jgi:hypothetical protein